MSIALPGSTQSQEEMIISIRNHFNYVETNLSTFEMTEDVIFEESTDGAAIIRYVDEGKLVKINIEYLGETGKLHRALYMDEGQLRFVFDQEFRYNVPYYIDDEQAKEMGLDEGFNPDKTKKFEHRYYFFHNKMIRWINPEGEYQTHNNAEWNEKQHYYLNELAKFK